MSRQVSHLQVSDDRILNEYSLDDKIGQQNRKPIKIIRLLERQPMKLVSFQKESQ